jgi:hypothetical protein
MKLFLSWSGERSLAVAEALAEWLPRMINALDPWICTEAAKGDRWQIEVANQLDQARAAVICLTTDNINAPWILFEAGALARSHSVNACTFLLDLDPSDLELPLSQFHHTLVTKRDVRRLVGTLNQAVRDANEQGLRERDLDEVFEAFWPRLQVVLESIKPALADDPLDNVTDEHVRKHAYRIYQAEDLQGKFSISAADTDASNGYCRRATIYDQQNHIMFGPYKPLDAPGDYIAYFRIKIGSSTPPGRLLYLDVVGGDHGDRYLHRSSFPAINAYKLFAVRFRVRSLYDMEYRILPMARGEFSVDYVAILKMEAFDNSAIGTPGVG